MQEETVDSRERYIRALTFQGPDRVPVMLHNFMMAAEEIGATMGAFREDPEVMARAFVASVETYGFDGILVDMDTVTLADGRVAVEYMPAIRAFATYDDVGLRLLLQDFPPMILRKHPPIDDPRPGKHCAN